MRLLLVDDDKKAARVLTRGFVKESFVVDVAHSGEIGDELAASNRYDLIVLDWLLPGRTACPCAGARAGGASARPSTC
jgi:DNA-binding response OmpR family regulator